MRMIYSIVILLILNIHSTSFAGWFCKDVASERTGERLNTCGVGEGTSENEARADALEAAYKELDKICSKSADCNNFEITLRPLRNDCAKTPQGYKCYRGIEATISTQKRDISVPRIFSDSNERLIPVKNKIVQEGDISGGVKRAIIAFKTTPTEATVFVDGIETCKTPCSRELLYGKHRIRFQKMNYDVRQKDVLISQKSHTAFVELRDSFGYLETTQVPDGARIKVDDILQIGPKIKLGPGKHILTIKFIFSIRRLWRQILVLGSRSLPVARASPIYSLNKFEAL